MKCIEKKNYISQIHFMKNIDRLSVGKTLIMVSNDLRFVPGFDWILVMDKGCLRSIEFFIQHNATDFSTAIGTF